MRLEGKVALITGAAAGVEGELMGFGGASARLFAREGAKVVVTDVAEDMGRRTVAEMRNEGAEAMFPHLDVTDEEKWASVVEATALEYGKLDILVNNAGTGAFERVEDVTVEVWDGQMDVHAKGAFLGTRQVIPEMRKAGGGSIVNISSIYGLVGSPTSTAYHAAKGAVRLFTKATAVQYASEGIRANSVHPGFAMTPLTEGRFKSGSESLEARLAVVPMRRLATADEIAPGILYLASDESSFVTGAELVIDGGMTAA